MKRLKNLEIELAKPNITQKKTKKEIGTHKSNQSRWNKFVCSYFENTIPYLEFELEIESNDLTFRSVYSKRQQVVLNLIKYLHEEKGLGYRKIRDKLNSWGIKTERGNTWFNTSVYSVLKRHRQREERIKNQRTKSFEPIIGQFQIKN